MKIFFLCERELKCPFSGNEYIHWEKRIEVFIQWQSANPPTEGALEQLGVGVGGGTICKISAISGYFMDRW